MAKALALGATAVSIGVGALLALGRTARAIAEAARTTMRPNRRLCRIGTAPGYRHHCHRGALSE